MRNWKNREEFRSSSAAAEAPPTNGFSHAGKFSCFFPPFSCPKTVLKFSLRQRGKIQYVYVCSISNRSLSFAPLSLSLPLSNLTSTGLLLRRLVCMSPICAPPCVRVVVCLNNRGQCNSGN